MAKCSSSTPNSRKAFEWSWNFAKFATGIEGGIWKIKWSRASGKVSKQMPEVSFELTRGLIRTFKNSIQMIRLFVRQNLTFQGETSKIRTKRAILFEFLRFCLNFCGFVCKNSFVWWPQCAFGTTRQSALLLKLADLRWRVARIQNHPLLN